MAAERNAYALPEAEVTTTYRYNIADGPVVDRMTGGALSARGKLRVTVVEVEVGPEPGYVEVSVRGRRLLKNGELDTRSHYLDLADSVTWETYAMEFYAQHPELDLARGEGA